MSEHRPKIAERAVVSQLLRDDHDERWSRAELEAAISDLNPSALKSALEQLERHGVIVSLDEYVLASRCARHFDELELVSV